MAKKGNSKPQTQSNPAKDLTAQKAASGKIKAEGEGAGSGNRNAPKKKR
ncbi:MAG TPA: hypothetical protein VEF04_02520 [Blastocatellia bacterium]|nr:hypothetical protein [Blastocatellia bacterium]